MAGELLRRGHEVKILYRRRAFSAKSLLGSLYKKFVILAPKDWLFYFGGHHISFRKLSRKLVGTQDVLIAVGPDCVEQMMELPEECGCKVFNVHGLTLRSFSLRETAWNKKIPKIVVSNYVREEIMKSGINKVHAVVNNGIDTSEYFPDEPDSGRTAVGSVYSPGIAKDPKTMMSVFNKLHQLRPNIPLICFGSFRRPKELIRAVRYKRLPTVTEARKLYSQSAVWFCASRSEGFGMPLLEAMACGCTVISTDCGGPNDFVNPNINGIIVEREAPTKMAEEIVKVMDDKSKQIQLAEEAIATARKLSWSYVASQMEIALEGIVSGRQVGGN